MVLIGHLFWLSDIGRYAVFGFFILSGYLMTLVMQTAYSYTAKGIYRFLVNRFLRLYPSYWIACLFTIGLVFVLGQENTTIIARSLALPETPGIILTNITMVALTLFPDQATPRLSPATWALTIELFYYLLIAAGISRTKFSTTCWFVVSTAYVLATMIFGYSWHVRYFALPAGSLPFSIGALLFFLQQERWQPKWLQFFSNSRMLVVSLIVNAVAGTLVQAEERLGLAEAFMYTNLVICTLAIYSIIRGGVIAPVSVKLDKLLGDFSYPIYLIHLQIGVLASLFTYGQVRDLKYHFAPEAWLWTAVLTVGASLLLIKFIDEPITVIRDRVKRRALKDQDAATATSREIGDEVLDLRKG